MNTPIPCMRVVGWPAIMAACWASIALGAPPAELPRYKLAPGLEWIYRGADPPETINSGGDFFTFQRSQAWTFNVLRAHDDGTRRILFRAEKANTRTDKDGKKTTDVANYDGYFDLDPLGRLVENHTLAIFADPTLFFPPLPADEAALGGAWSARIEFSEVRRQLQASPEPSSVADSLLLVEDAHAPLDRMYDASQRNVYDFDLGAGRVQKVMTISRQGWPKARGDKASMRVVELAAARQLPEAEAAALADEFQRYLDGYERYYAIAARASDDYAHAAKLFDEAKTELTRLDGQLKLPATRAMLERRLKDHAEFSSEDSLEDAGRFAALLDKPSRDWTTTDLEGHPHALADYRGKIVLLDFWYRGCYWCLRSVPQLNQLAADFKDNLVVLGMNSDENLDDARFVIDKLPIDYATLKNTPEGEGSQNINGLYGIHSWPTLVLIDGEGVVRMIHSGYAPTLRKQLSDKIRELLTRQPAAAK